MSILWMGNPRLSACMRCHREKLLTLNKVSFLFLSWTRKQSFQSRFLPFPSLFSCVCVDIGLGLKYAPMWPGSGSEGVKQQVHPVTFLVSISVSLKWANQCLIVELGPQHLVPELAVSASPLTFQKCQFSAALLPSH